MHRLYTNKNRQYFFVYCITEIIGDLFYPLKLVSFRPRKASVDNSGNIYIADNDNDAIRKVNSAGIISTIAGNGTLGFSGDGGPATAAQLYHLSWIAIDNLGNFYFTDQNTEVIRKINTSGVISTITGNLQPGYSGDGGLLIAAQFRSITGISFDQANNMYISDCENYVIRKVNAAEIISTVVGNGTRIRDALVQNYKDLINHLELPDKDDRHVLAAAIKTNANLIVTNNIQRLSGRIFAVI